jgi:hypothetical protein
MRTTPSRKRRRHKAFRTSHSRAAADVFLCPDVEVPVIHHAEVLNASDKIYETSSDLWL